MWSVAIWLTLSFCVNIERYDLIIAGVVLSMMSSTLTVSDTLVLPAVPTST